MGMKNKQALTEQDIAALAAGGSALNAGIEQPTAEADADAEATTDAAAAAAAAAAEAVEAIAATASTENPDNSSSAVQLLSAQLKEKDESLLQANLKLAKLEEFKSESEAMTDGLKTIVGRSLNVMRVALGSSAMDVSAMSAKQVLAEHDAVSPTFVKKVPVGGVAAVTSNQAAQQEPHFSPRHAALVNAVRFSKK